MFDMFFMLKRDISRFLRPPSNSVTQIGDVIIGDLVHPVK